MKPIERHAMKYRMAGEVIELLDQPAPWWTPLAATALVATPFAAISGMWAIGIWLIDRICTP